MNRKNILYTLVTVLVLAMFVMVPAAYAYDGRSGQTVTIGKDEVVNDDLYLGGTTVVVDGTVNGSLFAAGQTVIINGKVTGNVFAAGAGVTVNGEVGKSLIAAGQVVVLGSAAKVVDDMIAAGAGVDIRQGSAIGGSLLMAGAQGLVSSTITKDLVAGAGSLRLEGSIGRDARLSVGNGQNTYTPSYNYGPNAPAMPSVPAGLTFGADAHVARSFEYTSAAAVTVPGSVSSNVKYNLPPQDAQIAKEVAQRNTASTAVFDAIRRLVALLLVGLLFAWAAPRWITRPAETLKARWLPSLGVGLVGLVASPFAFLVSLGVVIVVAVIFGLLSLGSLTALTLLAGFPTIALVGAALFVVVGYLCQAIVAYLAGSWVLKQTRDEWNSNIFAPVLVGLLILGLLFAVPVAGGLLEFLVVLSGLGAIILMLLQPKAPTAPIVEAAAPSQM